MSVAAAPESLLSSTDPNAYAKSVIIKSIKKLDLKLLAIPVVFVVFRLWGTIRYFISMSPACHRYPGFLNDYNSSSFCVETGCFNVLYHPVLLYMQVLNLY